MNVIVEQILSNFELNDFNYLIDCIWLIVCNAIKHIEWMNKKLKFPCVLIWKKIICNNQTYNDCGRSSFLKASTHLVKKARKNL